MVQKSGAVFARRVIDWFQPYDAAHQAGYLRWKACGSWPYGLVPSEVWFNPGWEAAVAARMNDVPVAEDIKKFTAEFVRVKSIIDDIFAKDGTVFVTGTLGDHFTIQAQAKCGGTSGVKLAFPAGIPTEQIEYYGEIALDDYLREARA